MQCRAYGTAPGHVRQHHEPLQDACEGRVVAAVEHGQGPGSVEQVRQGELRRLQAPPADGAKRWSSGGIGAVADGIASEFEPGFGRECGGWQWTTGICYLTSSPVEARVTTFLWGVNVWYLWCLCAWSFDMQRCGPPETDGRGSRTQPANMISSGRIE